MHRLSKYVNSLSTISLNSSITKMGNTNSNSDSNDNISILSNSENGINCESSMSTSNISQYYSLTDSFIN